MARRDGDGCRCDVAMVKLEVTVRGGGVEEDRACVGAARDEVGPWRGGEYVLALGT